MVKIFSFGLRNDKIKQKLTNQGHYFRLSEVAGARLGDNNPRISDLSDPNRPLKLNEKMSELNDIEEQKLLWKQPQVV